MLLFLDAQVKVIHGLRHLTILQDKDCLVKNLGCWSWWPNHLPRMTQWIQYKLGKQDLLKKVTLPWESNPGPTPIRGDPATLVASVGLKKRVAIRHYIQVR